MVKCEHVKRVYSGEFFATNPPKWHWICEDCGKAGADIWPGNAPPLKDPERYERLAKKRAP